MDSHIIDKIVNRMKETTSEWLSRPKDDLDVIAEIKDKQHLTNMVVFHAQQAIERSLLIYDYVKKKLGGTT